MFGMGFTEILLIAIIAVIVLGPEKLPGTMVQIAKVINKFKIGLADAKSTLDNELNISELKAEASKFKSQIEETKASLTVDTKIDLGLKDIMNDDLNVASTKETTTIKTEEIAPKEKVSFKNDDKFKVKLDEKKEDNV